MRVSFFGTMYEWWQILLVGVSYAVPFGVLIGVICLTLKTLEETFDNK